MSTEVRVDAEQRQEDVAEAVNDAAIRLEPAKQKIYQALGMAVAYEDADCVEGLRYVAAAVERAIEQLTDMLDWPDNARDSAHDGSESAA